MGGVGRAGAAVERTAAARGLTSKKNAGSFPWRVTALRSFARPGIYAGREFDIGGSWFSSQFSWLRVPGVLLCGDSACG